METSQRFNQKQKKIKNKNNNTRVLSAPRLRSKPKTMNTTRIDEH